MQHVVHNPATIRMADRTDLSSRVTADEVNLDRFHNRIRKVCALVAATLILPILAYADNNRGDDHGDRRPGVPNGTYVFFDSGYYVPPFPGVSGQVPEAGAGQATFFANGTLSVVSSFSFGGQVFTGVTSTGTFTVNADGSVSQTVTTSLGDVLHHDLYPTPDGNTIAIVQTDPGSIWNGVLTRRR